MAKLDPISRSKAVIPGTKSMAQLLAIETARKLVAMNPAPPAQQASVGRPYRSYSFNTAIAPGNSPWVMLMKGKIWRQTRIDAFHLYQRSCSTGYLWHLYKKVQLLGIWYSNSYGYLVSPLSMPYQNSQLLSGSVMRRFMISHKSKFSGMLMGLMWCWNIRSDPLAT